MFYLIGKPSYLRNLIIMQELTKNKAAPLLLTHEMHLLAHARFWVLVFFPCRGLASASNEEPQGRSLN